VRESYIHAADYTRIVMLIKEKKKSEATTLNTLVVALWKMCVLWRALLEKN